MISSTFQSMVVLGRSRIRAVSRFSSAILADLAMRSFAISFSTLPRCPEELRGRREALIHLRRYPPMHL
jgi:hypothetical protein